MCMHLRILITNRTRSHPFTPTHPRSPKKNRADGAESRSELADGLGQGSSTAGDRYASDQAHHWFLARFRCTPTAFSAVMKAQDPTTITRYVKRFALAKVLKVDSGG